MSGRHAYVLGSPDGGFICEYATNQHGTITAWTRSPSEAVKFKRFRRALEVKKSLHCSNVVLVFLCSFYDPLYKLTVVNADILALHKNH